MPTKTKRSTPSYGYHRIHKGDSNTSNTHTWGKDSTCAVCSTHRDAAVAEREYIDICVIVDNNNKLGHIGAKNNRIPVDRLR